VTQGSYYWQPAENSGVRLSPPVVDSEEPPRLRDDRLPRIPKVPEKPRVREEPDGSPKLPVGIPQFAVARDQIAAGLKPSIEGLDWLQEHGYRTVLHVRLPGEDDVGDRKQVTKRGMKYVSLEVSPVTLAPAVLAEFGRLIKDNSAHPLFVYDKDGMLAGGLWYLYFRTVENEADETARIKANRLGLSEDTQGDHKAMWLAIQKYLSEQKP
jgi:hypothetical protein